MDKLDPETLRAHKGISFVGVTTSFLCYDRDGEFVMAKRGKNARDEQGTWDQGGGGLKWSTTAVDNVRREVKEEYGAEAQKIDFLGYRDVFRTLPDGTPPHWLLLSFAVLVDKKQVRNAEPEVLDEIGWFTTDTLPSPLHSQQEPFFEKYKEQLKQYIR
jgi:ADP-ribose pyrophosphatase YjhB (NUDIX family)